jgi:hypothetical protein
MKVWICQCLCPKRHCIAALAGEAEDREEALRIIDAPLRERIDTSLLLASLELNPWCGLCRAPRDSWVFELAPTIWSSMAEAEPALRAAETAQREVAAIFGDLGQRSN